jgi:hypothetical protein
MNLHHHRSKLWLALPLSVFLIAACQSTQSYPSVGQPVPVYSVADLLLPQQPGFDVIELEGFIVDVSHSAEGYVSVLQTVQGVSAKFQLITQERSYTYSLEPHRYVVVPLQLGTGRYELRVLIQIEGQRYALVASHQRDFQVRDDTRAYRYPNQIVNYDAHTQAVGLAFDLIQDAPSEIERVHRIYRYIVDNIAYDVPRAQRAQDHFLLPDLDRTLSQRSGICFDYAALMSAMLRSVHIPTRVVTGFTDLGYHAWVEVYIQDEGWINPSIYFRFALWTHIDPTFDASGSYKGGYLPDGRY